LSVALNYVKLKKCIYKKVWIVLVKKLILNYKLIYNVKVV